MERLRKIKPVLVWKFIGSRNSSSGRPGPSSWGGFARSWNSSLGRRPQEAVATFLAAQSTTWIVLYSTLNASMVAFPPELAAGWMCARLTRKFLHPINVASAAGLVRFFPAVGDVKVSPLLTGFVADPTVMEKIAQQREKIEKAMPSMKPTMTTLSRGSLWLQGPIDQYGLALYLSGKASNLLVIGFASIMISKGVDIESILVSWGINEGLGGAVGTIAASSAGNICFTPLHFGAVIYGIRGMENIAHQVRPHVAEAWKEEYYEHRRKELLAVKKKNIASYEDEEDSEKKFMEDGIMKTIGMCLLMWSVCVSMYSIRIMGEAVTKGKEKPSDDHHRIVLSE